ncbi:MAG: response regulator [Elusimicrobia bacterium]|nr:response regulator [Elusimicrobiota bacterium]
MKMLVIDDNMEFRIMISDYFSEFNFAVFEAENGKAGIEMAKKNKPDIIFLDVMMPDIGGIEVLRELGADEDTRKIPVIVITGTFFENEMNQLFRQESNCKDFLSKMAEIAVIQKKVEAILGKK